MNPNTRATIDNYVNYGIEPGSFMKAVLCNDLFGALGKADLENRRDIFDICYYIYNHISFNAWGSLEKYDKWIELKRKGK